MTAPNSMDRKALLKQWDATLDALVEPGAGSSEVAQDMGVKFLHYQLWPHDKVYEGHLVEMIKKHLRTKRKDGHRAYQSVFEFSDGVARRVYLPTEKVEESATQTKQVQEEVRKLIVGVLASSLGIDLKKEKWVEQEIDQTLVEIFRRAG